MRYIGYLIPTVRERTHNQDFSRDTSGNTLDGRPDDLILEFFNDGQDEAQAAIIAAHADEFQAEKIWSIESGTGIYTLPLNTFINNKIISMQYSIDGREENYEQMLPRPISRRITSTDTHPSFYVRKGNGTIEFCPTPTTNIGKAKAIYYRHLDRLDKRRGKISDSTGTFPNVATIILTNDSTLDSIALASAEYVSVNDSHGNVLMYAIPVGSYSATTRTITVETGFTAESTETIPDDSYITIGQFSTTHSKLPLLGERYLKLYAQERLFDTDSSSDAEKERDKAQDALSALVGAYADLTDDIMIIPVEDYDIMV